MLDAVPLAQFTEWLATLDRRLARLEEHMPAPAGSVAADAPPDDDGERVSEADIRAAYRLILQREPDPLGFADYRMRAAAPTFTPRELIQGLIDSDEHLLLRARGIAAVDVGGVQVSIDATEPEFGRAIQRDGTWEAHIIAQIRSRLAPGHVFVDIGANVGVMSFHAAQVVGPSGKVIAFEPNPDNVQCFLRGVRLNGFDQVTLFPLAASARADVFSIRGSSNTHLVDPQLGGRLVPAVAADAMLEGEPRIDLIKIDIEGHEPQALAGLTRTFRKHRPTLLIEFNPRCLREVGEVEPLAFARTLFAEARTVEIVEHDGTLTPVMDAQALIARWGERNDEHVARGDLPDGLVHFDLLVRLRS